MKTQPHEQFFLIEWDWFGIIREFDSKVQEVPDMVERLQVEHLLLNFQNLDTYLPLWAQHNAVGEWLPKLKQSGLKRLSILVPEKIIGQIAVRNIFLDNDQKTLPVAFFDELELSKP